VAQTPRQVSFLAAETTKVEVQPVIALEGLASTARRAAKTRAMVRVNFILNFNDFNDKDGKGG